MSEIPQQILDIYFWYKIGVACNVVCGISGGLALFLFMTGLFSEDGYEKASNAMLITSAICFLVFLPASIGSVLTPNRQDLKEAALLIIGKQAANSDEARKLISSNATYLEKQ